MRRIAAPLALALIVGLVSPGTVQAAQGEEEFQTVNGTIRLLTRFTDGEGGWPGLVRRAYNASAATNGLIGWVFPIDRETWLGRFELTLNTQQNPPGDADLGIYLYSELGDAGGQAAPTTTAEYDVRAPGGEAGFIPPDSRYGVVFMSRGLNVAFTYKGYTPMYVEVSEAGFAPSDTTVKAGGWVVWQNVGQEFHSVTADGTKPAFDSSPTPNKPLIPGASFSHQFTAVGDHTYHDRYGTATGVVHVVPGPGPGTPA